MDSPLVRPFNDAILSDLHSVRSSTTIDLVSEKVQVVVEGGAEGELGGHHEQSGAGAHGAGAKRHGLAARQVGGKFAHANVMRVIAVKARNAKNERARDTTTAPPNVVDPAATRG